MTSDRPYPGDPYGPDGSQQAHPDEPYGRQRQPMAPEADSPFSAFGGPQSGPADQGGPPPQPPAAARAAVRVPGLSSPPPQDTPPPMTAQGRGQVYGGRAQPPAQESGGYGDVPSARPQSGVYGAPPPAQPSAYGQPGYDQPGYDQPGYDQPGYDQPGYDQPGYDQPPAAARVYGQTYGASPDAAQMAPERPAVPAQRSPAVYGRPAEQMPDPAYPPLDQPDRGYPPAEPMAYGQRPQQYGSPQAYGAPQRPATSWQDQLQPMESDPRSAPASADVSVVGSPGGGKSKMRVVGYVGIVVAVILAGAAALYYTSRTSPPKAGTCVVQSNGSAVSQVSCSTPGAYRVGDKKSNVADCPDYLNQPSLTYKESGKQVVLCLTPAHS